MKIVEKERARTLRKQGKSMNQIVEETGFSKASVSFWTRDIVLTKAQRNKISKRGRSIESIEKRRLSRLFNINNKRRAIIETAKKDFSDLSARDLKLIGAMIYWGEGGKTGNWSVRLANSDPLIIKVMMRFFREICKVPENKFHAHIHTFENADVEKTEKYWSEISRISRKQFYKTYIKPSIASLQKRKTLPNGTLDIYVHDTKLFLTIMGWIEKIKDILLKP
ncbi:MAG: hypothetical protein A3E02_02300 [Candidatus Zambryskibacteria bacterium RIFCSPHIGHO2_12_FULL_38_34]|uniref:Homing endonuclease LAGLIDADG domain-containing protein n=1 Tax=Candidatus Zambryskibacteria bacterium RIFCSPLOWO2_12_FULL_39_16 TaxID=1802775 RepID=A0A1G2US86_9BACT|nr:MAG: hypothetical protein A3E02_02300 [Candidatus Zambryskibacteria bacterium RIFCSPHIGHO2_12_FULL_38_34]OHB12241.1 MAG: hypothetical protein A3G46_01305 [Candidatus Zambryskibacteria bacterium RIFCSPLOWO2_12_FULL_39_16]